MKPSSHHVGRQTPLAWHKLQLRSLACEACAGLEIISDRLELSILQSKPSGNNHFCPFSSEPIAYSAYAPIVRSDLAERHVAAAIEQVLFADALSLVDFH